MNWIGEYDPGYAHWKEALLSRGLGQIMRIRNAETYEARYQLVQGRTPRPDIDREFIMASLVDNALGGNGYHEILNDMTLEQANEASKIPLAAEPDRGPMEAWKWAYGPFFANCYFFYENRFLRQSAYVIWDKDRLALWGLFKGRRQDFIELENAYAPSREAKEAQWESQEARRKIYQEGGRGWWSPNDSSRIQWPEDQR